MKPVTQTKFHPNKGNCFAACIASLLELSIEDVPNFCWDWPHEEWWERTCEWVKPYGLRLMDVSLKRSTDLKTLFDGFWVASGKSPRGDFPHAVGYHGDALVHDPHPSREGITGPPKNGTFFCIPNPSILEVAQPQSAIVELEQLLEEAIQSWKGEVQRRGKEQGLGYHKSVLGVLRALQERRDATFKPWWVKTGFRDHNKNTTPS